MSSPGGSAGLRSIKVSITSDATQYVDGVAKATTTTRSFRREGEATKDQLDKLTKQYEALGAQVKITVDDSKRLAEAAKAQTTAILRSNSELSKLKSTYDVLTGAIGLSANELEQYNAVQKLGQGADEKAVAMAKEIVSAYQERIDAHNRLTKQQEHELALTNKASSQLESIKEKYHQASLAINTTKEEIEALNAVQSLGAGSTENQRKEVSDLIAEYHKQANAKKELSQIQEKEQAEAKALSDQIESIKSRYQSLSAVIGLTADEIEQYNAIQKLGNNVSQETVSEITEMISLYQKQASAQSEMISNQEREHAQLQKTAAQVESLISKYEQASLAIGKTSDEIELMNAVQSLGSSATKQQVHDVSSVISAYQARSQQQKELIDQQKKESDAIKISADRLNSVKISYEQASAAIGKTKDELEILNAVQKLGNDADAQSISAVKEIVSAYQERLEAHNKLAKQQEEEQAAAAASAKYIESVKDKYQSLSSAIGMTANELEQYNVIQKLGNSADQQTVTEITQIVSEYQKRLAAQAELTSKQQQEQADTAKSINQLESLREKYSQASIAIGKTKDELEVLNAVQSLGIAATTQQKAAAASIVVSYQAQAESHRNLVERQKEGVDATKLASDQLDSVRQKYSQAASEIGKTKDELELLNAVQSLGNAATRAQQEEVARTITAYQQQREEYQSTILAIQNLEQQYQKLSETQGKSAREVAQYNAVQSLGVQATNEQRQAVSDLAGKIHDMNQAQMQGIAAFGEFRGVAQNFGWQLQDTIVQLQMGTDAFVVLAQQGSQMASSFGAIGALVGAGIAIIGVAMPAIIAYFNKASVSAKQLEEIQTRLGEVYETSTLKLKGYTDEMEELYKVDKQLYQLKLATAINDAEKAMTAYKKQMKETLGDSVTTVDGLLKSISTLSNETIRYNGSVIDTSDSVDAMNAILKKSANELGIFESELISLSDAYQTFAKTDDAQPLKDVFTSLLYDTGRLDPKLQSIAVGFIDLANKISIAKQQQEAFSQGSEFLSKKFDETIKQWQEKTKNIYLDNAAIELNTAITELSIKGDKDKISSLKGVIDAYYKQSEAKQAFDQALQDIESYEDEKDPIKALLEQHQERVAAFKEIQGDTEAFRANEAKSYELYLYERKQLEDKSIADSLKGQKKSVADIIAEYENKTAALRMTNAEGAAYLEVSKLTVAATQEEKNALSAVVTEYERTKKSLSDLNKTRLELSSYSPDRSSQAFAKYQQQLKSISMLQTGTLDEQLEFQDLSTKAFEQYVATMTRLSSRAGSDIAMPFGEAFETLLQGIGETVTQAQVKALDTMSDYVNFGSFMADSMSSTVDLLSMTREEMDAQTEGMNDVQKAVFLFTQGVAAAQALVSGMSLGMKMADMYSNPAFAAVGTALGAAQAGAIMGVAIRGTFDKGGYIPSNQAGIVSEYGAELVNGALVMGAASVTSREDTAKLLSGSNSSNIINVNQSITVSGAGDKYLAQALESAAKKGAQEGAAAGYNMVKSDFSTGRGIRQQLKRSTGI